MNEMPAEIIPDERAFGTPDRRTLADVLVDCEAALTGIGLRDTRSAFRFLERQCGIDLAETLGRPQEIRTIFAGLSTAARHLREALRQYPVAGRRRGRALRHAPDLDHPRDPA